MIIDSFNGIAKTSSNNIHISSDYIANYNEDVRIEIIGVLDREMTHAQQWDGNKETPHGLIEEVADYVRLKAEWVSSSWLKRGSGSRWDEGYAVTAYFLEYCNELDDGFVAQLNALTKDYYTDEFFCAVARQNC